MCVHVCVLSIYGCSKFVTINFDETGVYYYFQACCEVRPS